MRQKAYSWLFIVAICLPVYFFNIAIVSADQPNSQQERAELQQRLQEIEAQIAIYEKQLATTKTQANTLANKVSQLKKQQAALELQILSTNLQVDDINQQIIETQTAIATQTANLNQLSEQLSRLIVLLWQQEQRPIWYSVVVSSSLNEAISALYNYNQVIGELRRLSATVQQTKSQLEQQQEVLTQQQESLDKLLLMKVLQQQSLTGAMQIQKVLLAETKGKESNYQQVVNLAKQQAAQIRSRIYQLLDVSTQITFGQALQIAQWVSGPTGVRPAFLLAILTQESNLGRNVGTCNKLGDPVAKSWRTIMKPERDQQPFLQITKALGMDPDVTPVSCPMIDKNGNQIGWGGAMGPAQFIPSTWLGYQAKVSALTGSNPANPWDIRDAFAAAAIKLKAGGADGTYQGEWNAAMRYFSGSTNTKYRFYGDNVMTLASDYQADIDQLN